MLTAVQAIIPYVIGTDTFSKEDKLIDVYR